MKTKFIILLGLIVIAVAWELTSRHSAILRFFISSPTLTYQYGLDNWDLLLRSTAITLFESLIGFLIAVGVSFILMITCIVFPKLMNIVVPITVISQILPIITLAPLFIVLFGMGILSKIAMVVLMCFFPVFINFATGVRSISLNIKELLYIYNAKKKFQIFKVILPLSTPYIFSGLKISTTMALMGAIVAEFVGARDGLGKNLYVAPKNSLPELMVCSVFLVIIIGWILFKSITLLEKKLGYWYI